jgi:NTP pyrophosphatase (non-canonical NTP hydrolase)
MSDEYERMKVWKEEVLTKQGNDTSYWKARAEAAEALLKAPALVSVLDERQRQDQQWGEQNHDPYTYMAILIEELGEMAQAALQTQFGGKHGGLDHLREEAVQTAAVALAIVECLDHGKWHWGCGKSDFHATLSSFQNNHKAD